MKIIIAGGRDIKNKEIINKAIRDSMWIGKCTEVVHGGCRTGVDSIAHDIIEGLVPIKVFPADWEAHGKAAGPIRNAEMAKYADRLILIWDGKSRGSASMKREMESLGKPVFEVVVKE